MLVRLSARSFTTEALVSHAVACESPETLAESVIEFERQPGAVDNRAEVLAYLPRLQKHLVQRTGEEGKADLSLVDLRVTPFVCDGCVSPVESWTVLAPAGSYTKECLGCVSVVDERLMAQFCFGCYLPLARLSFC